MPNILRNLEVEEGSLVDKGANQPALVMLFKRARPPDTRKEGSSTTDKPSVLKRIKEAVAKMMGMGDKAMTMDQMMGMQEKEQELYSKEWEYQDAFHSSVRSIIGDETMDMEKKKEMLTETMQQYHTKLMEHMQAMMDLMQETQSGGEAVTKFGPGGTQLPGHIPPVNDPVNKKEGEDQMPVTYDEFLKSLSAEERTKVESDLAKRYAPVTVPAEITKRLEELERAAGQVADLQKRATDAETKLTKAETDLAAEVEKRIEREYLAKAEQYPTSGTPEQVAAKLRKAYTVSKEFGAEIEADLAKTEELAKQSKLFESVGKAGQIAEGSAEDKIEKKVVERMAKGLSPTREQAYDAVIKENPDLYGAYVSEKGGH